MSSQQAYEDKSNSRGSSSIHFKPSEYGILDRYDVIKELYKVQLSPTVISLASNKETN